jgi:RimJ/RimL family protein N-acetyltransferase
MAGAEPVAGNSRRPAPLRIPELVGAAVRLRAWRTGDARALASAWHDESVARWTAVPPDTGVAAAERWIAGDAERRRRRVALDLVAVPAAGEDRVLGEVGLGPIQWDRRRAVIGYWTAAEERGRGVATEAVGLVVGWALDALPVDEIVAETAGANPASAAVLRANGFEPAVDRDDRRAWRRRSQDRWSGRS